MQDADYKRCSRCGETKLRSEFSPNGRWLMGACKVCERARSRRWAQENREKARRRGTNWYQANLEYARLMNSAQSAVYYATRKGKLVRPDACSACGAQGAVHGHHADYSKPLEVEWLCNVCHMNVHRRSTGASD